MGGGLINLMKSLLTVVENKG